MTTIVSRFGTTQERVNILEGLLKYRQALAAAGITNGIQWLDGSFVENVEQNRSRAPIDIDVVTLASRPVLHGVSWSEFVHANRHLFDPTQTKQAFKCDAYYIDLSLSPDWVVQQTCYWFGLFTHQRETFLWKGMLSVPLLSDDDDAARILV